MFIYFLESQWKHIQLLLTTGGGSKAFALLQISTENSGADLCVCEHAYNATEGQEKCHIKQEHVGFSLSKYY